ncbi:MAG: pyridoxamine 5'-phosphate oxidase family protein [Rhodocyclaceae bacterium]
MSELLLETDRSRVRRLHKRASYDRATAHALLDAQPMCSVGYILNERPYVTPTLQWRDGNRVFWHGSSASRVLRTAAMIEVCLSVAILDGFVMARSGYNHSVNSRSLTLFGTAEPVRDNEKRAALDTFVERLWPGRVAKLRPPTEQEIRATAVLSMEINEGSLKIRGGAPEDEDEDYALPIWAGTIPLRIVTGVPVPDPRNLDGVEMPDHIRDFVWPDREATPELEVPISEMACPRV